MAKKLDPDKAKPFQPLAPSLVSSVIDEDVPAEVAVALEEPPAAPTSAEEMTQRAEAPPRRRALARAEKVVTMRRGDTDDREPRAYGGGERLNRPLKVQLAPSERNELQRIVNQLSIELGTPVSASHVARALLAIFRNAEDAIVARARQSGTLKRPPNDDLTAIAAFEFRLAKLLSGALREAPSLRE